MKTGVSFSDYIISEKGRQEGRSHNLKQTLIRGFLLPLLLVFCVLILFVRLFTLQVVRGKYYRNLSNSNRIRTIAIHAPRGVIFDRNGVPLVFNIPGFREEVNGKTSLITQDEALSLIAKGKKDLEIDSLREYPYRAILAHVLGYIGQISKRELGEPEFSNYTGGELIGKLGIEKEYESVLKGVNGKELIEVNSMGETVRKLGQTDPIPGQDIKLTIDLGLQKAVFSAMKDVKKGAGIVSTPRGSILAMVSKPSFDPNLFTLGSSYKTSSTSSYNTIEQVISDNKNEPLLNRAIGGTYPPGSTFKIIVASAGLEDGIIDKNYEIEDTGILRVGDFSFSNWYFSQYGRTDGLVNVVKGIKRSNDIFFYKLGEKIGVDKISAMAEKFGVGGKLGIDLGGESLGLLPTTSWKKKALGEPWFLGDTYHYAIGQGYLLTTPLQVNTWTQAIANGGSLYKPHLLLGKPETINKNFLSDNTVSLIREGMIESCSPGGVGWPLFEFRVHNSKLRIDGRNFLGVSGASGSADMRQVVIACKTGTAQHGGEKTLPHAWITLFAPAYNPQIAVTVLVEDSGEGSNIAAPIARKILDYWFSR